MKLSNLALMFLFVFALVSVFSICIKIENQDAQIESQQMRIELLETKISSLDDYLSQRDKKLNHFTDIAEEAIRNHDKAIIDLQTKKAQVQQAPVPTQYQYRRGFIR